MSPSRHSNIHGLRGEMVTQRPPPLTASIQRASARVSGSLATSARSAATFSQPVVVSVTWNRPPDAGSAALGQDTASAASTVKPNAARPRHPNPWPGKYDCGDEGPIAQKPDNNLRGSEWRHRIAKWEATRNLNKAR
jgi:hypothetical protein